MKLDEFLQLDYVISLNEILDTHIPVDGWYKRNTMLVGQLTVNDEQFEILLEPGTYSVNEERYSFINVAFEKIVDGKATRELQLDSKNASSIIGAVVNALNDRLKDFQYDAIVFGASDNVEKRMKIYNVIANKFSKMFKFIIRDVTTNYGTITILISNNVSTKQLNNFIEYLKIKEK